MGEWFDDTLKNICMIGDGAHASIKRTDSGVMYLTSKNFKPDGIDLSKVDLISEGDYRKHFKAGSKAITVPKENDLLLSIIGTLGAPYLVKSSDFFGLSSSVSILRPDQTLIDPKYLFYWLKSPTFQSSINMTRSGVAQSFLSLGMIGILPVRFPKCLTIQKKIAGVLSAYDDLIESNLKRIKLLEEMAQITYEEWFVRRHFPNHETTPINPETGLPEGWKQGKIGDLIGFQNGFAFKSKDFVDTGYPVIKIKNIGNNTINIDDTDFVSPEVALAASKFRLGEGDLLIAMTGATIGKVGFLPYSEKPCYLNQRVGKFIGHEKDNLPYVFAVVGGDSGLQQVLNLASGAAQPNISGNQILSIRCTVPEQSLLGEYNNLMRPVFDLILKSIKQNTLLKEARDLLLPRLMTGLIDIDDYLSRNGSAAVAA
jgi:type I restriction enzyme, S subunit